MYKRVEMAPKGKQQGSYIKAFAVSFLFNQIIGIENFQNAMKTVFGCT